MDELIRSVSIDNMLNQREAVSSLLHRARILLLEAADLATAAHLGTVRDLFNPRHHAPTNVNLLDDDGHAKALHILDGPAWVFLMSESGNRTFLDKTARNTWDESISKGDYPPLTKETIVQTFGNLHLSREEMFDRGVLETFKRLSWNYKTNQPFKFGKRIILTYLCDQWGHLNHRPLDELEDLHRVFCVLDGQLEPDHRHGVGTAMRTVAANKDTTWTGPYFAVRWYKKGTGHVTFTRPELVTAMNRILAKHYPHALASTADS